MRNLHSFLIALGVMLAPAICPAQRAAEWRDSAMRLEKSAKALHDSLLEVDSSASEVARRGDLVLAASANQKANALEALDKFAKVRDRWFGGAMPATGGFRIVILTADHPRFAGSVANSSAGTIAISGLPDTGNSVRHRSGTTPAAAANMLVDHYGLMMMLSVPKLIEWVENPPPLSLNETERRDQSMYAFVTATGPFARRCVSGGLVACEIAMKLRSQPSMSVDDLYAPYLRADLFYFALELGGTGAWARLTSAADSGMPTALAAAARMPVDSILSKWRADLLSRRPVEGIVTAKSALIAVVWTTILLAGALGASKWV